MEPPNRTQLLKVKSKQSLVIEEPRKRPAVEAVIKPDQEPTAGPEGCEPESCQEKCPFLALLEIMKDVSES